jgi:lysyl-tRNA synthetase class 2
MPETTDVLTPWPEPGRPPDDGAARTAAGSPGGGPAPPPAAAPAPAAAAARDVLGPLAEHRRRVRVRVVASRVVLVLAVLGLLSSLLRGLWRVLGVYRDVLPGLLPGTAARTLVAVSVLLLLAARGLRRGSALAWGATVGMLALAGVLHLLKGLDVLEAALVLGSAGWLATQRRAFPVRPTRRAVLVATLVGVGVLALLVAAALAVRLYVLARDPSGAQVARVERWLTPLDYVGSAAFLVVLLWTLLSPRRPPTRTDAEHRAERERARRIVRRHGGGTLDYFALRDDKDWFVSGDAVVAYSARGGVALVSPDPIGPPGERELAWADFLDLAGSYGWSVTVVGAGPAWVPVYEASGLRAVYLGDEAVVDCRGFSLAGSARKSLRQAVNRVARAGYTTTFHDPARLDPPLREALLAMSGESRHGEAERGFSMTLSRLADAADTGLLLSVTRTAHGRVDAFCQWVPARDVDGWSLDVMRRRTDADDVPNGLVEATVVATIQELDRRGERGLGLNFAVLREVVEGRRDSRLDALVRPVLLRLSQGTQLTTLAQFNDRFDPAWLPRYVVLDSVEFVAAQAVVVAGAEGVTELPVVGRFLRAGAPR